MTKYTCQCGRCDGSGRYDRGTCFDCKGVGYTNQSRKPRGLYEFVLTVTYSNGSVNTPRIYASSREKAVQIIERQLRINGWTGKVE